MTQESEISKDCEIERKCIDDARQLWTIQEQLLQSYRTYLIVLNSLLAAGSCTLIGRLYSEIGDQCEISNKSAALFIILSILFAFIIFGFGSLFFMIPVIRNRGYNVHLCQFVLMMLTLHRFFDQIQLFAESKCKATNKLDFSNMSLLAAFKMVEHPEKHDTSFVKFVENDDSHHYVGKYLWYTKDTKCKCAFNELDHARYYVNGFLKWMFIIIWTLILLFFCNFIFAAVRNCDA